jgi:hypothetical protein
VLILPGERFNLAGETLDARIQAAPTSERSSRMRNMRGERTSVRVARMPGSSARRKRSPCRTATPRSQKEGADLVDDAGALTDQSFAHAVQPLQVELVGGLGCNKLHGRALHCLGDRLRIAEVVLLSL